MNGISTCDPEVIRHVLHGNFNNYVKGTLMLDVFEPFFGKGIFNVNGPEWKHQR